MHFSSTFLLAIAALLDTTTAQIPDIFQGSAHLDNKGGVSCAPDTEYAVEIDWVDFDLPLRIAIITPNDEPYGTDMIPFNKKHIVGPTGFENSCEFGFKLDKDYNELLIEGDSNLSPNAPNGIHDDERPIPLC
ncbi:hypothetical protein HYALB_00011211 [Hymenoscyphus albidus]|uniref:Uncharacterized protein n=1 Tax=Hymenoscyphus albidus TaxID=595503 RepID=A0A9N9LHU6_9HELO|nr:hypothetical protein HYALB_00011211 [Hymenoscyphus albidus]